MRKFKRLLTLCVAMLLMLTPLNVSAQMNGIDISNWQSDINVSAMNVDFVVVKATEGSGYTSPSFTRQANDTLNSGKKLGLYHYMTYMTPAKQQAEHFVRKVEPYINKAVLVLDFESTAVNKGVSFALEFLQTVENLTGVKPMIYMSQSVAASLNWSTVINNNYALWVARYPLGNTITGFRNDLSYGNLGYWDSAAMFQYTSHGRLSGYSGYLDLDIFYGDESQWDAYAGGSGSVNIPNIDGSGGAVQTQTYTVRSGDCLSTIGQRFGVSWGSIASANGIYSPYIIYPGQVLNIPGGSTGGVQTQTYTVRSGDCLSIIAQRFGVSWGSIASANGIYSPYTIYPGQVLTIPGGSGGTVQTQTYTVRSGDCLSTIAQRFGVSWGSIASANGIYSPYTIYPGQVLRIA